MNHHSNAWQQKSSHWSVRVALAFSILWLAPTLACGSFAPRPTPTPTLPTAGQVDQAGGQTGSDPAAGIVLQEVTPTPLPTNTPEAAPTATFTPTPVPGTALAVGQPARIAAPGGLNMRQTASTAGAIVTYLAGGQVVDVIAGPAQADGYIWWQLDDRNGNQGWTAEGDGETEWLSPALGEPQAVNRAPRVGDRVVVTTEQGQQLSIRSQPGPDAPLITRINQNAQLTILAGPQSVGGFNWYQVRSDDGSVEGWAADGDTTRRWLSPLE
ncbi:MAG: SH3 domain-containing protein [Caldilineaceae bacterium]|nr:SH3 domain-containing protein [Caldilineaceae bacterium]